MDPVVGLSRLSLIWVQTNLSALRATSTAAGPCSFLRHRNDYDSMFDRLSEHGPAPDALEGLGAPWEAERGCDPHRFWRFYLQRSKTQMARPWGAWRRLVPFRRQLPVDSLGGTVRPRRLLLEAFHYPHGIGIVFTADCGERLGLRTLVDWAFQMRKHVKYRLPGEDEGSASPLEEFVETALMRERQVVVGREAPRPDAFTLDNPFSLATIIKCEGVDPAMEFPEGPTSMPHRALEALTRWQPNWQNVGLPGRNEFDEQVHPSDCDVLYAAERGRAIWFPTCWQEEPRSRRPRTSLSCYHRNLTLASLQVESLSGLIGVAAGQVDQPGPQPSWSYRDCVRNGAHILSHLYAGSQGETYRARSLRRQIWDGGHLGPLNRIYDHYDWPRPCALD